jgi:hypothetical protein
VISELNGKTELACESYRSEISDGILISQYTTQVAFRYSPGVGAENGRHRGTIILFDSLDGIVHTGEEAIRELYYYEYCVINLDGTYDPKGVRKVQEKFIRKEKRPAGYDSNFTYVITASKYKDHVLLTVDDGGTATEYIIALPDSSRFVYIGLTGENCSIRDVSIERDRDVINPDLIPRIADKISYIDGNEGDIPNVQIDGTMTEASEGIPITDGLKISFHTKSLPTARLIWHCPYICIFHAGNRTVGGVNYREYATIRLDGEITGNNDISENKTILNKTDDFNGWDEWKKYNKEGFDCVVSFERNGNRIITDTNNFGISIRNITTIKDGTTDLYAALTGDQCALTNIRMAPRDGVTGPF